MLLRLGQEMEKTAVFQNLRNPDDVLIVSIRSRQTANVPTTYFAWDTVTSIRVISGESPLDGLSFPIIGNFDAGYAEAVKYIMKHHKEYQHIS